MKTRIKTTIKKLTGLLLTFTLLLGLFPTFGITVLAGDSVSYVYYTVDGTTATKHTDGSCTNYTVVTDQTTWDGGTQDGGAWYVLKDERTIDDRISVSGTVNLILCDDATLTAAKGITVAGDNTLNIYAQSGGTGELYAGTTDGSVMTCERGAAGIGGGDGGSGGSVTIHGGGVTAIGGEYGAGIGGGNGGAGGSVTIYGGSVTATGGNCAAGIGGGDGGEGGSVIICGGSVTATGGFEEAGIGGGFNSYQSNASPNGTLTLGTGVRLLKSDDNMKWTNTTDTTTRTRYMRITDQSGVGYIDHDETSHETVTKLCETYTVLTNTTTAWEGGTQEGGTWYVLEDNMTIWDRITVSGTVHLILCDGATLTAKAGITVESGKTLNIYVQSGGTGKLYAGTTDGSDNTCDSGSAGIGSGGTGIGGAGGSVTIHGGTVTANGGNGGAGIGGGSHGDGGNVTIYGGSVTATGGTYGAGIGGGNGGNYGSSYGGAGGDVTIYGGSVTANGGEGSYGIGAGFQGNAHGDLTLGNGVKLFTSGDGSTWTKTTDTTNRTRYMRITDQPAVSYIDHDEMTHKAETKSCWIYTVLTDQTTWENGTWYVLKESKTIRDRISVSGTVNLILCDGATLTAKSGITVTGDNTLNIYAQSGGTGKLYAGTTDSLSVTCDSFSAGIGGVEFGDGGSVTIHGGSVTATGGFGGAGIGGGSRGGGGSVTIYGGSVIATGIESAHGIGAGIANGQNGTLELGEDVKLQTSDDGTTWAETTDTTTRTRYMKTSYIPPHTHSWSYSADAATITATCGNADCPLTEGKATLTINAPDDLSYDGSAKPATISGDTDILGTPAISYKKGGETLGSAPKDAGTYIASITLGTDSGAATASMEYTIAPKSVTVSDITATNRDYNGERTVVLTGGTISGKVGSDDVDVDLSGATGTMADANAGTDKAVTVSGVALSGADAGNYELSAQPTGVTVTIDKITYTGTKEASVTVRSGQITTDATLALPALPDGASYAESGTVGGTKALVSGHSISGTTLTFSTTSQADQVSATITVAVTGATNYKDYDVVVTVTAKAKEEAGVTINGNADKIVTYGTADFTLSKTVTAAGTGTGVWTWTSSDEAVATVSTAGSVSIKKAGSTTITAKYESDTTIGEASITLTVDPKTLTITWSNTSFTYDGASHAPTATLSGVKSGDSCTVSVAGAQINAGTGYTATASLSGAAAGNYKLPENMKSHSFTIGKAAMSGATVTLGTALTYIGSEQTQTVSKVQVGTRTLNSSEYTITNNKGTNAGSYTLTITAKENSNYTGSVTKSFTIAKKAITPTVTVTGTYSFTGSAITPSFTVKDGSKVMAESEYTTVLTDNVNAGTAKLTVTAAANGNYSFDPVTKEFTINKAAAQSLADITKEQGFSAKTVSASVAGLMPENAGTLTYTAGTAKIKKVSGSTTKLSGFAVDESGKVSAAVADGTAGDVITLPVKIASVNYQDSSVNVVVTLLDKTEAGVSFTEGTTLTKTYGDAAFTLHGNVTEAGTGSGAWSYESGDASVATVAADGTVTISGAGSTTITAVYESESTCGEAELLLTVEKKPVTITGVTVSEKEYDGTTKATITNAGTVNGAVAGDDVKAVAGTAVYADKNAGSKAVTFEGFTLGGTKAANYELTAQPQSITGTILPKALTAAVTAVDRVYEKGNVKVDLTDPSISGVLDGEEVSVDFSAATAVMADADAGSNKPVSVSGVTITGTNASNYSITQPAGVTVNILKADYSGVSEITRTFLYTEEAKDSVELSAYLPEDRGTLAFLSPVTEGTLSYKEAPALSGTVLSYALNKADTGKSGTIGVTAVMQNYKDFTLTVNVRQIALALYEKNGKAYEACPSKLLNAGKSFTLVPMFADGTVLNERVVWASTDPDVATVSQDGKVTGRSAGSTVISVQSEEDPALVAYCAVEVTEAVTAVIADKSKLSLGIGESAMITAQVLPFTADQKLEWSADNGNVKLEVSEDTMSVTVSGVSTGNAKVTAAATDGSGKKAVVNVSVGNPVPDFTIAGKGGAMEVQAGKSLAMQISWKGDQPKNADVIWSVTGADASYIASIDAKGVLNAIMAGKVTVTAVSAANPEKSASTVITVTAAEQKGPEITAISFTNADKLAGGLAVGKSVSLKTKLTLSGAGKAAADAVAWVSSDSSIASVNQKGVVKALAPGEVTVTALPRNAADISAAPKAEITFTVTAPVKSVKIDKKKMTLGTQDGSEFGKISIVSVLPENASNPEIEWTVNNANVQLAAIAADGSAAEGSFAEAGKAVTTKAGEALAVRALTPGVTKLTGTTTDGSKKKVSCTVTVRGEVTALKLQTAAGKNGVNDVTLSDDEATAAVEYTASMKAGGSMSLKALADINGISAAAADADAKKLYKQYKKYTDASVSFRSSDTSVLTVNNKGKVSVKKDAAGKSAVLYVASADGKYTAAVTVTVK